MVKIARRVSTAMREATGSTTRQRVYDAIRPYIVAPRVVLAASGAAAPLAETGTARTTRRLSRLLCRLCEIAVLAYALLLVFQLATSAWTLPNGDVGEYHRYALAFWQGVPPFTHLPVEYPPLALLPFGLTLLPDVPNHLQGFAYWMGAFCILGYLGFLAFSSRQKASAYVSYMLIGALGTLLVRFDLVPALLTLSALWALKRRQFHAAYVLVALGTLIKLYPAVLIPVVVIAHWNSVYGATQTLGYDGFPMDAVRHALSRGQSFRQAVTRIARVGSGVLVCVGIIGILFWIAIQINPSGALSGFGYLSARPLQVESFPATLLWLGSFFGLSAHAHFSYFSFNLVGPLDAVLMPAMQIALIVGGAFIYWRQATRKLSVERAFLAIICLTMLTGKVFSPQYIIWVLPLVAEVEGFDIFWLIVAAFTTLDYPILYHTFLLNMPLDKVEYALPFLLTIAIRNAVFLYVTVRLILPAASHRKRPLPAETSREGDGQVEGDASGTFHVSALAQKHQRVGAL